MQRRSIALHPLTPLMQEGAGGRAGVRGGGDRRMKWGLGGGLGAP